MAKPEKSTKSKAAGLALLIQRLGLARGRFRLGKSLVLASLLLAVAVLLICKQASWFWAAGLVLLATAMLCFDLIVLKRIARVDMTQLEAPAVENREPEEDEKILTSIPAVLEYGKVRSISALETGRVLNPENALLITNKAIWALTVPLPGVDKVIAGLDIGQWQWLSTYQDISSKLLEMIQQLPLAELLSQGQAKRLMGWTEIQAVEAQERSQAIRLKSREGKKFYYSIRLKEDYLRAKEIFRL